MNCHRYLLQVFCFVLGVLSLSGQVANYASILGNVTDESGAAITNASVSVLNTGTGVEIKTTTNDEGAYEVRNLVPGTYKVTVSSSGFQTVVRDNGILEGGRMLRIDVNLRVGDVTQVVEVTGAASQINTETATTTLTGITHKTTTTLPSQASVTSVFPDVYNQLMNAYADMNNSAFSIGGTLSAQNGEVQDGMRIEGQPHFVGGNRGLARPGIEAVEELVITTTSPSAKYPNPSAIEMLLKSGSNNFHGSLAYLHGNKALNATSYFTGVKQPFLLNQYFGSLGGPIKKNKTFFFFAFQGFHHPNRLENINTVPTAKMRAGDLSDFLDPNFLRQIGAANPIVVRDPTTGQPFANNQIPSSRISQVARNILDVYPLPNRDEGRGYIRNFYLPGLLIRKEKFNYDTRIDHYWTPTQHTYGRFSYFDSPNAADQTSLPGFGGNYFIVHNKIVTLHHTSTVTPSLINHIMFGSFREDSPLGPGLFNEEGSATAWNQQLGINGIPQNQDQGFPLLSFTSTSLTAPVSWSYGLYQNRIWHFRDDVTWNKGKHNIQLGAEFRRTNQGSELLGGGGQRNSGTCEFGCINFNGRWSGLDYADFLLGLPSTATRRRLSPPDFRRRDEYGFYIQDDIRMTQKFNLSLGLRYDFFPVVRSDNGLASVFDFQTGRLVFPSQESISQIPTGLIIPVPVVNAEQAGFPSALLKADKNNWGPRVGFAYRMFPNSVIRGGVGVYHSPLVGTGRRLLVGPFEVTEDFPLTQPPVDGTPVLTLANPYPGGGAARPSAINFFGPEIDPKDDRHYNYNLAIEHQIGGNAITAEFVGKKSIVPFTPERNTVPPSTTPFSRDRLPYPALGSILGLSNGAHYNYHAFRLDIRRRFVRGLFFNATYVFSKTIDDLGGISGETAGNPENPFDRVRDRGQSGFMPRHRMTINYIYEVPFGKPGGMLAFRHEGFGKVANYIIGGWETAGTYNFTGDLPLTPTGNYLNAAGQIYDPTNTNRTALSRPDYTGEPLEPNAEQRAQGYVFNPNAFTMRVPPGRFGSAGRGILNYGEGTILMNQSFFRNFRLRGLQSDSPLNLRIGFLMYNALNHSNAANPVVNVSSPLFGRRTNDKLGNETRTISFQARIDF